jgi:hypothetical protein
MRRTFALCAAAGLGLAALAATSPAQANPYHLIRWQNNGFCQPWDESLPIKPFPSDYKTISARVPTLVEALAVKEHLLRKGACKF